IPPQRANVSNKTQITAWFNEYFDQETTQLHLKANSLNVHLGKLEYDVVLDKTIQVQGLNYLKGFGVQDMQFTIPPDDQSRNMKGHLIIPNAGVLTLGLGNLTFNLTAGAVNLGLVHIYNLDLKLGNNTPPFEGEFYFDQRVPSLPAILDSQKNILSNGQIELNATANATVNGGQHINYLEGVLNKKSITFHVPVMNLLADVFAGVLASGGDGSQGPLPDVLSGRGDNDAYRAHARILGADASGGAPANATVKRAAPTLGRSMRTNLLRLGLRSLRSKVR
ncbi:hypothetical protein B0T24DRAFT_538447, partial [Lasiosphaeria ovina]